MEKKILKSAFEIGEVGWVVGESLAESGDQNRDLRSLQGKQANCSRSTGTVACRVGGGGG